MMGSRVRVGRAATLSRVLAAAVTVFLWWSAFAPMDAAEAGWVALVPLLLLCRFTAPRAAMRWGFGTAFVYWAATLAWLLQLRVTGGPWPLVLAGWVALAAYSAVYTAAFCFLTAWLFARMQTRAGQLLPGHQGERLLLLLLVPLLWAGLETARGVWFTGFPWNPLGVSQYRNPVVSQVAALGGVPLLSALMVAIQVVIALTALRTVDQLYRRRTGRWNTELTVGLALWLAAMAYGISALREVQQTPGVSVRVAAIQPAVEQRKKWTDDHVQEIYDALDLYTRFALLSREHLDLIVWPETALPGYVMVTEKDATFVHELLSFGVPLLVGSMDVEQHDEELRYFNGSYLYLPEQGLAGAYRKQHLVMFGEYLPWDKHIPLMRRFSPLGFSCWPGEEASVFRLPQPPVLFSPLICFEDVLPYLSRRFVRRGARLLVNQTNDAWFDGTAGPIQHMSHSVFRCIENRVPMVRAANSGVSCFIGADGRIRDAAVRRQANWQLGEAGYNISAVHVPDAPDRLPRYTRYGDWLFGYPALAITTVLFVLVGICHRRQYLAQNR